MTRQLTELVISNFRSIKGQISIPLDAPIVLIHGANGAGKTSIASALELALTGDVAALRRSDDDVQNHLVNRDATSAEIELRVAGGARTEAKMTIAGGAISGKALLDTNGRTFFADRCYLSQSTLGRLLDIYQAPASRDPTNTPLTNFVKNLLGLDQLEALIDGLHAAGHKARMSKLSADFDRADQLQGRLEGEQREHDALERQLAQEQAELEARLAPLREALKLPADIDAAAKLLDESESARSAADLDARVSSIVTLQRQWSEQAGNDAAIDLAAIEREEADAAAPAEAYRTGPGKRLAETITRLRSTFPDIADPDQIDPEEARKAALALVTRELDRLEAVLANTVKASQSLGATDQQISQFRARISLLDRQVETIAGDTAGLGQALAALLPHIHDEICPVCQQDYSLVPGPDLRTHVTEEVARLVGRSEQLRELMAERQRAQTELAQAERSRGGDASRVLPQTDVTGHQQRIALLRSARAELEALAEDARRGATLLETQARAATRTAQLRLQESTGAEIRVSLEKLARTMGEPEVTSSETTDLALSRLLTAAQAAHVAARKVSEDRDTASEIIARLQLLAQQKTDRDRDTAQRKARLSRLLEAQRTVKRERDMVNALRTAASEARTAIVGRVFNERLNAIWSDLFVRLAPSEPFVPAFMLPKKDGEPVSALLETVHREGGIYGRPGAMLSAGNLNTAALTLFLSLHLSVTPELPWLILDDPVQSMDELHIAQFAALLRTLAKGEDRQIIIAIHERQLFDYLTLELSPAFPGDKLITVEVSKTAERSTQYKTNVLGFEPDRLVA